MRLDIIDGMRGHLLVGMMVAHLMLSSDVTILRYFHHSLFVGVYDAEFFVPISGLLIGILFARKIRTPENLGRFLRKRLKVIYRYYILSAVPFLILAAAAVYPDLASLIGGGLMRAIGVLTLQEGGRYSDILPIYFYCMLLMLLFTVIWRGNIAAFLLSSAVLYLLTLRFMMPGLFGLSGNFVVFNIAAWQFLFVLFFFLGAHHQRIHARVMAAGPLLHTGAIVLLGAVALLLRGWDVFPLPFAEVQPDWPYWWARMHLHPIYLAKILVLCLLVYLLLLGRAPVFRILGDLMAWYFRLGFLRTIGSYSIQMFVFHVYLMALFDMIKDEGDHGYRLGLSLLLLAVFVAAPNLWRFRPAQRQPAS